MTLTETDNAELRVTLAAWSRERDVRHLAELVVASVGLVRAAGHEQEEVAKRVLNDAAVRLELLEHHLGGVGRAARWFFEDMARGEVDPENITQSGSEELVKLLESAMANPGEGFFLLILLAAERGLAKPTLATLAQVGLVLERLRSLDPELAVASPGITAYYDRYSESGQMGGGGVEYTITRALVRALG